MIYFFLGFALVVFFLLAGFFAYLRYSGASREMGPIQLPLLSVSTVPSASVIFAPKWIGPMDTGGVSR